MENTSNKIRFREVDFTKGILVSFMVLFHLSYIGMFEKQFGYMTQVAYAFHIPGFLLLSGFLTNFNKGIKTFISDNLRKIFIPFIIFEFCYILLLFAVGKTGIQTSNIVSDISISSLADKLFLHPIGTYWYLYTLIICNMVLYFTSSIFNKISANWLNTAITATIILFLLTSVTGIKIENIIYYVFGICLKNINTNDNVYNTTIKPSILSIIPFILIVYLSMPTLDRFSISGIVATYLVLSFCSAMFVKLKLTKNNLFSYLGRNSLSIVVFSPFFTFLSKFPMLKNMFSFDKSGILLLLLVLLTSFIGSLFIAYIFDRIKVSKYIFGMSNFYKSLK
ncbi:MAG: acyltransferase [Paludibacter sp.]|nr:acyltransferase [Paludibacter sp.]